MRVLVLRSSKIPLLRSASIAALALTVTGCSSGFERFDSAYNSVNPNTVNSQANTPAGVDATTTASISRRLVPVADVAPKSVPAGVYHPSEPTYVNQPRAYQPQASYAPAAPAAPQYQPRPYQPYQAAPVQQAPRQLSYTPPKPDPVPYSGSQSVYIPDSTTTASVAKSAPLPAVSTAPKAVASAAPQVGAKGWTSKGGTNIVARSGETLYNLSKRYGVPVDSIRRANGMSADDQLKAGQTVVIPSYRYSPTAKTSAPDSNSGTKAAHAGIGFVGEADPSKVPVPLEGPRRVAHARLHDAPMVPPTYQKPAISPGVDYVKTGAVSAAPKVSDAPARTGIQEFRWPVKGRVVSGFGSKTLSGANEGIDISVPEGTAVRAVENGVVIYAGNGITEYGNLVLIQHADDWVSAYAHNRDFSVKKGDRVVRGDVVARSGKSGNADQPKLHFELRKNSVPVNPTKHLSAS